MNDYNVYVVSGNHDGELVFSSNNLNKARAFAERYEREHADELDSCFGGTMILDAAGAIAF